MYRFYSLYDKLYRDDILMYAWKQCRANKGSAGVDGLTFKEIETKIGVENYIAEIKRELRSNSYKPQPVRRVYLDKPDGSKRPLGIPTVFSYCTLLKHVLGYTHGINCHE